MWQDCRELMQIPAHIYVDDGLWGQRGNAALNTTKKTTYKQPNPYYIPSTQLKRSDEVMKKTIIAQRKLLGPCQNGQLCIFLISSQVKLHNGTMGLHTNVLVAKLEKPTGITCKFLNISRSPIKQLISFHLADFLYEPLARRPSFLILDFVTGLTSLSFFDVIYVIFGTQRDTKDCLHRAIDWISQVKSGHVKLDRELYDKFPLQQRNNRRYIK